MPSSLDLTMISGPPLLTGPTRRLINYQRELLVRLGLEVNPVWIIKPLVLVLVLEGLLLVGTFTRLLALHLGGQLANIRLAEALQDFFTGQNLDGDDRETLVTVHMVTTLVGHVLLLPQLYLLVMLARERRTVFLQLALAIMLVLLTLGTQTVHISLKRKQSGGCEESASCTHGTWAWFLTVNIFIFLTIILVRVLFHLRLRQWLVSFKAVGPLLEFFVSRKCRELQALLLIIGLGGTSLSGMVINTGRVTDSLERELTWSEDWARVVLDTISYLLVTLGLLVLVLLYLLNHQKHSHTIMVDRKRLESELVTLGEEYRQVLLGDRTPSRLRYCPATLTCGPVDSGQILAPRSEG